MPNRIFMKRIILMAIAALTIFACAEPKTKQKAEEKVMEKVYGELSNYGVLDSTIFLPTKDSTEFAVKLYQGKEGLMLESSKALSGKLFGIKSTTGYNARLKYTFNLIGMKGNAYLYIIPYEEFPSFWGAYYLENFEYCWIYYNFDDYSNDTQEVEFSKSEFEKYFNLVKAYVLN